jgi:hypothetical protein
VSGAGGVHMHGGGAQTIGMDEACKAGLSMKIVLSIYLSIYMRQRCIAAER